MPIKKRLTPEQRANQYLGLTWKRALRHPLLSPLVKFSKYNTSALNVFNAVSEVKGWKGASYQDKVFVFLLCNILWRATGESYLSDPQYDRLGKHISEHIDDVLDKCGLQYHSAFLWDSLKLRTFRRGTMELPHQQSIARHRAAVIKRKLKSLRKRK